jgi:hypothetical protein
MRLLIACRRRVHPARRYRLEDLARASGMSISGVRTAYDEDEVARLTARPAPSASRVARTGGPVPGCTCRPPWPTLVVHAGDGDVAVVSSATPRGLACLYRAYCASCGAAYPGPFRVAPAPGQREAA